MLDLFDQINRLFKQDRQGTHRDKVAVQDLVVGRPQEEYEGVADKRITNRDELLDSQLEERC